MIETAPTPENAYEIYRRTKRPLVNGHCQWFYKQSREVLNPVGWVWICMTHGSSSVKIGLVDDGLNNGLLVLIKNAHKIVVER